MLFDYISKEEYAELRGAEQYDIGFEKGIEKVARSLKEKGLSTELIAETTGLSPEEIEAL